MDCCESEQAEYLPKKYLISDIEKLSNHDISKLYKYVRRHLIAKIDGLGDPLESDFSSRIAELEEEKAELLEELIEMEERWMSE